MGLIVGIYSNQISYDVTQIRQLCFTRNVVWYPKSGERVKDNVIYLDSSPLSCVGSNRTAAESWLFISSALPETSYDVERAGKGLRMMWFIATAMSSKLCRQLCDCSGNLVGHQPASLPVVFWTKITGVGVRVSANLGIVSQCYFLLVSVISC